MRPAATLVDHLDLRAVRWSHVTARTRAMRHEFVVRTTDEVLGRYLDGALGTLAATAQDGATPAVYSLMHPNEASAVGYTVGYGADILLETPDPTFLLDAFLWHVNQRAITSASGNRVLLHAACGVWDSSAIVMPAASGAGKSTLVSELVRRGLGYLSDEVAGVDPHTLHVDPYPRAISLAGDLPDRVAHARHPSMGADAYLANRALLDPRRVGVLAEAAPVRWVVAPRYRRAGGTRLVPMRTAEAVMSVGENWLNTESGSEGLEAIVAMCRGAQCFRLEVDDLDDAADLVMGILESGPHGSVG